MVQKPTEHHHMDVWKETELRIPSMQHGHEPDLAFNPTRAIAERDQGFTHRLHQLVVENGLVLPRYIMELGRDREHQVVIVRLRKTALRRVDPLLSAAIVAFDAGAVPAGSVFLFDQATFSAGEDSLPVSFGAAFIEVEQGLLVARRHIVSELPQVLRAEPIEDLNELVHALEIARMESAGYDRAHRRRINSVLF
jgi:hypothetical protein